MLLLKNREKKVMVQSVLRDPAIERVMRQQGMRHPLFKASFDSTNAVLKKIKQRVPETTQIDAFSSDWGRPYHPEFKRIADNNGIDFIAGSGCALRNAENRGITTKAADTAHWNNAGHQIVADVLQRYLEKTGNLDAGS